MKRMLILCLCLVLMTVGLTFAEVAETDTSSETKELSGMSIVGNDEAPKSLYIVPWRSSEIGVETSLHTMLNDSDGPVDRDVFMRQIEFYRLSTAR